MIIPTGPGTWLHMESGAVIADDGAGALTITHGAQVTAIAPALLPRVRALLGHLPPRPAPDPSPAALALIGGEKWTPERKGM